MTRLFCSITIITVSLIFCAYQQSFAECSAHKEPVVIKSVEGRFDDVWEDLKRSLEDRGLVISNVSYIGEMLERTGKDIERTKKIFGNARSMEFCSSGLSRDMFEKNPHFITFCPYQITVYALPDDEKKIYLSYRRPIWNDKSGRDVLNPVERLLGDIINDVIRIQKEYH